MSRGRGDRGSAMVVGVVLMFAFTAGAIIWLARDVDRAVSDRASAQSIAFQAARSGAQQVDIDALRRVPGGTIDIDRELARVRRRGDRGALCSRPTTSTAGSPRSTWSVTGSRSLSR